MKTLDFGKILAVIAKNHDKAMSGRQIMTALNLPSGSRRNLHRLLRELERQKLLKRIRGGRYALARESKVLEGVVRLNRRGDGMVRLENGESVRIANRFLAGAGDGDTVRFSVMRRDRMNRVNGQVQQVVERSGKAVVGVYQRGREGDYILPVDSSFSQPVLIGRQERVDLLPGDWVVVRPSVHCGKGGATTGELLQILGNPSDPKVEILAAASRFSIPLQFSPDVIVESEKMDSVIAPQDMAGRKDLRRMPFVTIDGESARDFDDAVTVSVEGENYRLFVAIADVSHYVLRGSAIDESAIERGTSVYFPGFCLPMLPEKLSNDICSLKPDVDRLTLVAEIAFDRNGQRLESVFYPAIIRSQARMTYHQVQGFFENPERLAATESGDHLGQLATMQLLADILTQMRQKRGSLELDIPEPEVVLGPDGLPETIQHAKRLKAHCVIEEFMLAANEAVAQYLSDQKYELPYRIHEPPELADLAPLNIYLESCSARQLNPGIDLHTGMQELVASLEGQVEKRMVSRMLLQSMKQARYSVENVGHFGLAAKKYCHFTSPIRRYPDLMVHRILKQALRHQALSIDRGHLESMAEQSSRRERLAIDAERDVLAMMSCRFMEHTVGQSFSGVINNVQKFGLFIELVDYPVQGLVHISKLEDDYYLFDADKGRLVGERTGQVYSAGIDVNISVENVNIARREIDFNLVSATRKERPRVTGRGRKKKSWK